VRDSLARFAMGMKPVHNSRRWTALDEANEMLEAAPSALGIRLHRPSAYFWFRVNQVCGIGLLVGVLLSVIGILAFHQFWIAFIPGLLAVGSQTGNIGGLVQRSRELQSGYTTVPWLAGEVTLRDPKDGQVLLAGRGDQRTFASMKRAREFASQNVSDDPVDSLSNAPSTEGRRPANTGLGSIDQIPVGRSSRRSRSALRFMGLAVLASVIAASFVLGSLREDAPSRALGFSLGVIGSLALLMLVIQLLNRLYAARANHQLRALSVIAPDAMVIPVRRTVELFGEIDTNQPVRIDAALLLSIDDIEVALWSGSRTLHKVMSISLPQVHDARTGTAHDTRGNEKSAILVAYGESRQIKLFLRRIGHGVMTYADEATTGVAVARIRAALAPVQTGAFGN
jgi:hypothetical protein